MQTLRRFRKLYMLKLFVWRSNRSFYSVSWSDFACQAGSVAVVFAVQCIAILVCVGAAIDISRWFHARQHTIAAIDTAVLAAARELQLDPRNAAGALAAAEGFYRENVKERLRLASDSITFRTEDNDTAVTASGAVYLSTTALTLVGIERLSLLNLSGSEFSRAVLAIGPNGGTHLELALALDISSSMTSTRMSDFKEAMSNFVNMTVRPDQSERTSRISLVPFSGDVRVPADMIPRVREATHGNKISKSVSCGNRAPAGQGCTVSYFLTPCMAERQGTERYSDASPGKGKFVMPAYSLAGTCSTPGSGEIIPLSSDRDLITQRISDLKAGSGAAAQIGLAWAWYTLSPQWNSVWQGAASNASDYGSAENIKVVLLVADGEFTTAYDSDGVRTSSAGAGPAANGAAPLQASALCEAMKSNGIRIYTVAYGIDDGESVIDVLRGCASSAAMFYRAQDGSQLKQALTDVALRLSSLHLTH
jgi:Flp pilus assembly protein TadG